MTSYYSQTRDSSSQTVLHPTSHTKEHSSWAGDRLQTVCWLEEKIIEPWNHGIIKVGKDLCDHPGQPSQLPNGPLGLCYTIERVKTVNDSTGAGGQVGLGYV